VATRLWLKQRLGELDALCVNARRSCLERAASEAIPMPGYTHLQRAVVSSTAMWWAGWAEAFIDDAVRARQTRDWLDANPLGSAAGYGVNLALDRDHTTQRSASRGCRWRPPMRTCRAASSRWRARCAGQRRARSCAAWPGT
jgi:argininosuccinate lyase